MSIVRRPGILAVLASMLVAGLSVIAPAAHASTGTYQDDTNESGVYDPRGDITAIGADYTDGQILLVLGARATEPIGSSAWTARGNQFQIDIDLDRTGYSEPEFSVVYWPSHPIAWDPQVAVRRGSSQTLCYPTVDVRSDHYGIVFPASCIGSPPSFVIRASISFDNGFTRSSDQAPNYYSWCC
ncbi:MAG TPA: hypothetical protein VG795_07715, partial [Acidimicrobiia bacterium]|nr:hypothetical protein [Acidimicrobiia bacterium]